MSRFNVRAMQTSYDVLYIISVFLALQGYFGQDSRTRVNGRSTAANGKKNARQAIWAAGRSLDQRPIYQKRSAILQSAVGR